MWLKKRGKFYHFRFMHDGRLLTGSTKEAKLGPATTFVSVLKTKLADGAITAGFRKSPTLRDFAGRFLLHVAERVKAGDLDHDTQRCYQNGCRLLSATRVWDLRIDRIGRPDAAELVFPGSASNANQALRTLSRMLNHAAETGALRAAPRIKLRKEHGREAVISPWLEQLLLEHARPVLRTMMVVMLDCGMRPDEVCRMRWEDVRWDESTIFVQHGKSLKARRYVGMTARIRESLEAYKAENGRLAVKNRNRLESPWVFPSRASKGKHATNPKSAWQALVAEVKAKVPALPADLVLYSCRHTFATRYYNATKDIATLSKLLGHGDLKTTMRYTHVLGAGNAATIMDGSNSRKLRLLKREA